MLRGTFNLNLITINRQIAGPCCILQILYQILFGAKTYFICYFKMSMRLNLCCAINIIVTVVVHLVRKNVQGCTQLALFYAPFSAQVCIKKKQAHHQVEKQEAF